MAGWLQSQSAAHDEDMRDSPHDTDNVASLSTQQICSALIGPNWQPGAPAGVLERSEQLGQLMMRPPRVPTAASVAAGELGSGGGHAGRHSLAQSSSTSVTLPWAEPIGSGRHTACLSMGQAAGGGLLGRPAEGQRSADLSGAHAASGYLTMGPAEGGGQLPEATGARATSRHLSFRGQALRPVPEAEQQPVRAASDAQRSSLRSSVVDPGQGSAAGSSPAASGGFMVSQLLQACSLREERLHQEGPAPPLLAHACLTLPD